MQVHELAQHHLATHHVNHMHFAEYLPSSHLYTIEYTS